MAPEQKGRQLTGITALSVCDRATRALKSRGERRCRRSEPLDISVFQQLRLSRLAAGWTSRRPSRHRRLRAADATGQALRAPVRPAIRRAVGDVGPDVGGGSAPVADPAFRRRQHEHATAPGSCVFSSIPARPVASGWTGTARMSGFRLPPAKPDRPATSGTPEPVGSTRRWASAVRIRSTGDRGNSRRRQSPRPRPSRAKVPCPGPSTRS